MLLERCNGDPGQPTRNDFHPDENLWGGDISLEYRLSDPVRLFALLSRGYKAGGFNPSLARALGGSDAPSRAAIAFEPENLVNYELGVKGSGLGGRLSAAASLFWMDRQDMQVRSSAQFTDNPNDFVFITSNAEGHAWGLEASLSLQATERWRLHGSLGLLHSEVDDYALEREPERRYQHVSELGSDVKSLKGAAPMTLRDRVSLKQPVMPPWAMSASTARFSGRSS